MVAVAKRARTVGVIVLVVRSGARGGRSTEIAAVKSGGSVGHYDYTVTTVGADAKSGVAIEILGGVCVGRIGVGDVRNVVRSAESAVCRSRPGMTAMTNDEDGMASAGAGRRHEVVERAGAIGGTKTGGGVRQIAIVGRCSGAVG